MALADLANVPSNYQELTWWSFAHADLHGRTNTFIQQQFGILLPLYILDPVDTSLSSPWGDNHQLLHNNNDAILGVTGYDVSEPPWGDQQLIAGWIWLHYQLHYAEAQASGVA